MEPTEKPDTNKTWEELAAEAAHESDPAKLLHIVKDLCTALDEQHKPPASVSDTNDHPQELFQQKHNAS